MDAEIHNPTYPCTCHVERKGKSYSIAYCPTHAAAPDLLAVVQQLAWRYESEQERGSFPQGQTWETVPHELGQAARAAIARAEGRAE